jgi:hypothetical protein
MTLNARCIGRRSSQCRSRKSNDGCCAAVAVVGYVTGSSGMSAVGGIGCSMLSIWPFMELYVSLVSWHR